MDKDLFGNALHKTPPFELTLQQKRQAALLYYWMSDDYLRELIERIKALIAHADHLLDTADKQGRDAIVRSERWGERDTGMVWAGHVYPALQEFLQSSIRLLEMRESECYRFTRAYECARMLDEYSSRWMTEEEEKEFNEHAQVVFAFARHLDDAERRRSKWSSMHWHWQSNKARIPHLPKFRVHTDEVFASGGPMTKTGVFVPFEEPFGGLQFAWAGDELGGLDDCETLNAFGQKALAVLGADVIWEADQRVADFLGQAYRSGPLKGEKYIDPIEVDDPNLAPFALSRYAFEKRPAKWYFVELIEGEFDEESKVDIPPGDASQRLRCEGGQLCPQAGFWSTPAQANSRRNFNAGELMPEIKESAWGATIWYWDAAQG